MCATELQEELEGLEIEEEAAFPLKDDACLLFQGPYRYPHSQIFHAAVFWSMQPLC